MNNLDGIKLALKVAIGHNTDLLGLTPEQLLEHIDRRPFTDLAFSDLQSKPRDVCYMVEQLQESLNCLLDARKRLLMLGLYKLGSDYAEGETREQEIQIRARNSISESLEENGDSDSCPTSVSPEESVEI